MNYLKYIVLGLLSYFLVIQISFGQILNADQFGKDVADSSRFHGDFKFGFDINKQKDLLTDFYTSAELSYLFHQELIIFAGNFDLFKSGSDKLLNGGYGHLRFRAFTQIKWNPELFVQYQLDEVRGLEERILAGANLRYVIYEKDHQGVYVAVGGMYEKEMWTYDGVEEDIIILDRTPITNELFKINSYVSFNRDLTQFLSLNLIGYYQIQPSKINFGNPRVAGEASLQFNIYKGLTFDVTYVGFFDDRPVVPIDKYFYSLRNSIRFNW